MSVVASKSDDDITIVKWGVRHFAAICSVLGLLITSTAVATALQIQVNSTHAVLQTHVNELTETKKQIATDRDRLNELTQELRYIRKELDRANTILDKIDKRMP